MYLASYFLNLWSGSGNLIDIYSSKKDLCFKMRIAAI